MIRTGEWYLNGYQFLKGINKRYNLITAHYLESMFIHYRLWDEQDREWVGPELQLNCVKNKITIEKNPWKSWVDKTNGRSEPRMT